MADEATAPTYWDELSSPLNLVLIAVIVYLVYKIVKSNFESDVEVPPPPPQLPKIRKDLTVSELKKYDGTQPDGRVLLAVNCVIFDVTKGKKFYGPGKCYTYLATNFILKLCLLKLEYKSVSKGQDCIHRDAN